MSVTNEEILESIKNLSDKIDTSVTRINSKLENIEARLKIIENNFTDQNSDISDKLKKLLSVSA